MSTIAKELQIFIEREIIGNVKIDVQDNHVILKWPSNRFLPIKITHDQEIFYLNDSASQDGFQRDVARDSMAIFNGKEEPFTKSEMLAKVKVALSR
jgi:hypothetical protein